MPLKRLTRGDRLAFLKRLSKGDLLAFFGALIGAAITLYVMFHTEPLVKEQAGIAAEQARIAAEQARIAAESLNRAKDTEARVIWNDFLTRFDNNEMWSARTNLISYCNDLAKVHDRAKLTTDYLAYYVFHTRNEQPTDDELRERIRTEDLKHFFRDLDWSRRLIKNFHQDIMVLSKESSGVENLQKALLSERFYNASEFLEWYWLPVEKAQNIATQRYAGNRDGDGDDDRRAQDMLDWYKKNIKHDGKRPRPGPPCSQ